MTLAWLLPLFLASVRGGAVLINPQFKPGDKVRWNYWVDRRESGWHYGIVESGPEPVPGSWAYKVRSSFVSWINAELLEPVEVSE